MADMISESVAYSIEGGSLSELAVSDVILESSDEDSDLDDRTYYEKHFYPSSHITLTSKQEEIPVVISMFQEIREGIVECKIILRRPEGTTRIDFPLSSVKVSWWRSILGFGPSQADILKTITELTKFNFPKLRQLPDTQVIRQAVLNLEEKQHIPGYKFGFLLQKEGQTKEDEIFSNQQEDAGESYDNFLSFIGEKVELLGWQEYRGGLDVKSNATGKTSLYTKWKNKEIMWHVGTMLPYNFKDKQQLERKRHIGNDVVVCVFQGNNTFLNKLLIYCKEGNAVFKPSILSSRQIQCIFLVREVQLPDYPDQIFYKFAVCRKEGVSHFSPVIPEGGVFKKSPEFRNFFYTKLFNAEKASYQVPLLQNKLKRTKGALLQDLIESFP